MHSLKVLMFPQIKGRWTRLLYLAPEKRSHSPAQRLVDTRQTRDFRQTGRTCAKLALRGAYHFFWPLTPWQDQATNFMDTVGALSKGDLPPVLDLEEAISKGDPLKRDAWKDIPANQRLSIIQNWLTQVEQGLGLRPMIYTRQNFIELLLGDSVSALATCPLWIAHYQVPAASIPPKWTSWTFWQYSEAGGVDGVQGNVDCDRFSGSLNDLKGLTKS